MWLLHQSYAAIIRGSPQTCQAIYTQAQAVHTHTHTHTKLCQDYRRGLILKIKANSQQHLSVASLFRLRIYPLMSRVAAWIQGHPAHESLHLNYRKQKNSFTPFDRKRPIRRLHYCPSIAGASWLKNALALQSYKHFLSMQHAAHSIPFSAHELSSCQKYNRHLK